MRQSAFYKNRFLVLAALLFLLACCAGIEAEKDNQKAAAFYKMGVSYFNENKIQQAFVEFQKAYQINPKDKDVLNAIGLIYLLHFDEVPKAIEFFENAVRIDPDFSEAYNNLGFAHETLGDYETAISYYKKAVSNLLYPTPEKAYINMGNSYYRMGKYKQAIESFKQAIKRAPNLSLAYMRLALCYNAMSQYGYASSAMAEAIKLDPLYKGDKVKAMEDFRSRMLKATGPDEQDIRDYIEILKY